MFFPLQLKNKINQYDPRVWYLFITRVFNALGFSIIIPFLSLHLHQEMNVSMSIIGSIFLFSALARASSQYITGEISDRWGRKGALLIGAIGRVIIFTFLGLVVYYNWSFLALGFGIVLSYVFGGMFFTSADAMIADIIFETITLCSRRRSTKNIIAPTKATRFRMANIQNDTMDPLAENRASSMLRKLG